MTISWWRAICCTCLNFQENNNDRRALFYFAIPHRHPGYLLIVTLGIYSAWAKVRRTRYFYANTRLVGASSEYHGKPAAILKGRIDAMALFGDASAILATVPAVLLDLKYSRDAELEADDFAAGLMKAAGLDPARLAVALERLAGDGEHAHAYLSSHPATAQRVARLGDRKP